MEIAIVIYDGVTALDAVGPYEVFQSVPGVDVKFVARVPGAKRTDFGRLGLIADHALGDVPAPDVVVVPGTPHPQAVTADAEVLEWIRAVHETSRWTTSVCTGALALGAAGVLAGKRATTHWLALDALSGFGATPVSRRVVRDGKVVTAAGVSSGIDMALLLVGTELGDAAAQQAQLIIEYDPQPPYDAGSPQKAPAAIVEALRRAFGAALGGSAGAS